MGKTGMGDRETSNINIEIGRLSYAKQRLFNTFNISTNSLKIWKFKDKRAVGISINENFNGLHDILVHYSTAGKKEQPEKRTKAD